jgi:hypothetical protein
LFLTERRVGISHSLGLVFRLIQALLRNAGGMMIVN